MFAKLCRPLTVQNYIFVLPYCIALHQAQVWILEIWQLHSCRKWFSVYRSKRVFSFLQCNQLIEQYEPLLVQLLLQTLDPDFVCMVRFALHSPAQIMWSNDDPGLSLFGGFVYRSWEHVPRQCRGCWDRSSAAGDQHTGVRTWRPLLAVTWVLSVLCYRRPLCVWV